MAELSPDIEWIVYCPVKPEVSTQLNMRFCIIEDTCRCFPQSIVKHSSFSDTCRDILFLPHAEFPVIWPLQARTVCVIHDIIPTLFLTPRFLLLGKTPPGMITAKGITDYFLLRKMLRRLDTVITVSHTSKKSLLSIFSQIPDTKIKVIYNGIDPLFHPRDADDPDTLAVLQKLNLKWKSFVFYFGGHTVRKNAGSAYMAWKRLPPEIKKSIPFCILGKGYWEKKIKKYNDPGVKFIPVLTQSELAAVTAAAVLTVYPSRYEGFGMPVIESLASGTPVLPSHIPTTTEILGSTYPSHEPSDISEAHVLMAMLLEKKNNDKNIHGMVQRAAENISEKFSWKFCAAKTLSAILNN